MAAALLVCVSRVGAVVRRAWKALQVRGWEGVGMVGEERVAARVGVGARLAGMVGEERVAARLGVGARLAGMVVAVVVACLVQVGQALAHGTRNAFPACSPLR